VPSTTQEVAALLLAAYEEGPGAPPRVLGTLYADEVHLSHVAPLPGTRCA
jgi:hypothetical protein